MGKEESKYTRLFLGKLSNSATESQVRNKFEAFGTVVDVVLKNGFGFVDMADYEDASVAKEDTHHQTFCGERLTVEFAKASAGLPHGRDLSRDRERGIDDYPWREREKRRRRSRSPRKHKRLGYAVSFTNLSTRTSIIRIKEMCRQYGRIHGARQIDTRHVEAEFKKEEDAEKAVSKLDGTELKDYKISVKMVERGSPSRSRSRSSSGSSVRKRLVSRSPKRKQSRSRSPSASPKRRRRSPSASPKRRRSRSASPRRRRRSSSGSPPRRRRSRSRSRRRSASRSKRSRSRRRSSSRDRRSRKRSVSRDRRQRGSRSRSVKRDSSRSRSRSKDKKRLSSSPAVKTDGKRSRSGSKSPTQNGDAKPERPSPSPGSDKDTKKEASSPSKEEPSSPRSVASFHSNGDGEYSPPRAPIEDIIEMRGVN